ncbi:DNA-processing protein DprA [Candidatus Saccharibacteria bacterium]|nr:DNA-processing protein DprA [Candidatus Saccharibacteria bacterium]
MEIKQISPLEHNFTEVLKRLVLIPKTLYYYGKIPVLRQKTVAIVGARRNTQYGYEIAYKAAYEAARAGAVVVSGLAYGVDSIAHRAALDAGGVTIGVLGTPIDQIYPAAHKKLAQEIVEKGGAIVSEYGQKDLAVGGKEMRARFLARNRIIAGLSDAVLVAEAADRSGTLNTAMHALDCGVELLAVPGDITRLTSVGCNRLIKQGAIPYTEPDDLLDLLFPERIVKRHSKKLLNKLLLKAETEIERAILREIFDGAQDGDEISKKLRLSASEFAQVVTMLEIKGLVVSLGMNKWMVRG